MQFILDVFILLIPYYTGYFAANNNGINFALQILLFVIALALVDLKNNLCNKNR